MYSFNLLLADRMVTFSFDNGHWHEVFAHRWASFINPHCDSTHYRVELRTDNPHLEPTVKTLTPNLLVISYRQDRLTKYTFKTLNYGLKRALGRWFFDKGVYLIHASGIINTKDQAILFSGPQGSGKSTAALLMRPYTPISDDSIFISSRGNKVYCYTTPFYEKHNYEPAPKELPLKAIFLLHKSLRPYIQSLSEEIKLRKTIQLFFMLHQKNEILFGRVLTVAKSLTRQLPWYELHFPKSSSIGDFLYKSNFL